MIVGAVVCYSSSNKLIQCTWKKFYQFKSLTVKKFFNILFQVLSKLILETLESRLKQSFSSKTHFRDGNSVFGNCANLIWFITKAQILLFFVTQHKKWKNCLLLFYKIGNSIFWLIPHKTNFDTLSKRLDFFRFSNFPLNQRSSYQGCSTFYLKASI